MTSTAILASPRQRGNPVLKFVVHVPVEFSPDVKADFVITPAVWALFVSLRFHVLHPSYLDTRISEIRRQVKQLIILCLVDMEDYTKHMQEVSLLASARECTLMVGCKPEEVARYLESYKVFENKPASAIQERVEGEHVPQVTDLLTSIRSVNKTDVLTLMGNFRCLADVMKASPEALATCIGFGEKKVRRVYDHFHSPLRSAGGLPRIASAPPAAVAAAAPRLTASTTPLSAAFSAPVVPQAAPAPAPAPAVAFHAPPITRPATLFDEDDAD